MEKTEMIVRQGIDSKALLVTFIRKLPRLLLVAVAGAIFGSGLYWILAFYASINHAAYAVETEYYIDFSEGRIEAKDYYNDFTWNDVIATDLILGRMMDALGAGYDREAVRQMLHADILSDVRYLTITVTGSDAQVVSDVNAAFCNAITVFGASRDEFDSIELIEDNGVKKVEQDWFSWRAAVLGMFLFLGIGIFLMLLEFMVGDRFYTKTDVIKYLELEPLGLICKTENRENGRQESRLLENLRELLKTHRNLYLLDAADGADSEIFMEQLRALDVDLDFDALKPCEKYCVGDDAAILVIVPFEKNYREKITDEINNAIMHGGKIAGAVLTECDRHWVRMYYGKG
ncbi:MAG: hypothetical protein HDR19_03815 [Lachnospiraceae bacterium]|nr:hypothetical protein [Lachnospiraceae bacterium]